MVLEAWGEGPEVGGERREARGRRSEVGPDRWTMDDRFAGMRDDVG